ncbi:MAG TPA: hypothetical protein VK759_09310 [Rhizomicrobium sp.]|jgi:hypothetical protein|nr:hypothetical protein [Rhizomicrobium sp.]
MRNYRKAVLLGGLSLATLTGGCASLSPYRSAQVFLYCQPGFVLENDYLCHRRSFAPPPVNYAVNDPPASSLRSSPPPHASTWGRDLGVAGAGVAAAIGATKLAERGASGAGAAAGETAAARMGAGAAARTAVGIGEAAEGLEALEGAAIIEEWWLLFLL